MPRAALVPLALATLLLAGCGGGTKEEVPSPDTYECRIDGARWLLRFTDGEARLLSPEGTRINLYQIAAASGVRFTNGYMELRGKGMDLQLIRESVAVRLVDCLPYVPPATPD